MESKRNKSLYSIIATGLMAALVFVGNYLQIPIPNGALLTRIHLGNSMCLLAGLLFGSVKGGLASGIGAALYDLLTPAYIVSAPFTFLNKFAMGFTSGYLAKRGKGKKSDIIIAGTVGQLVYIALYLIKTFLGQLMLGETVNVALKSTGINAITSSINGILAVVISVPLYFALTRALAHTPIGALMMERPERKKIFTPVTAGLTAFAVAVTAIYTIDLANTNKEKKRLEEKEAAYQEEIMDLQYKLDFLTEQLGIEIPERPADEDE